jgi:hypothetical protein
MGGYQVREAIAAKAIVSSLIFEIVTGYPIPNTWPLKRDQGTAKTSPGRRDQKKAAPEDAVFVPDVSDCFTRACCGAA